MISFIMMAKNVEKYIGEAIIELQKENNVPWELIVIDDHSDDSTYDVALKFVEQDSRVIVVKNKYKGKIMGTNYGYSISKGHIIKCIDSDDVLLRSFFDEYDEMLKHDAHCHDMDIVDHELKHLAYFRLNTVFLDKNYEFILSNLLSFPKASWSFSRRIADIIFPMPENLPFEDVWMAMNIKKNAESIYRINKPLYLYRQHTSNTFGGILNYDKDKVIFRANRLIKLIDIFKKEERIIGMYDPNILDNAYEYNSVISRGSLTLRDIFLSNLGFGAKLKLLLLRKCSFLAKKIAVLKWKLDGLRN